MARHNHPEQTVEKILEVSQKLFMEKGYDKTSIQDIIDAVGMSKGIIYYHFKSKEDVFDAVMKKQFSNYNDYLLETINSVHGNSGKEKLINLLDSLASDSNIENIDEVLLAQVKNPQFIIAGMQESIGHDAPIIRLIVDEGIEDGSIQTDSPLEVAEIILFLLNIWCNPMLFERSERETKDKLLFVQKILKSLNVDVISDSMIYKLLKGYHGCYKED